jgi:hypothetical protein
MKQLVGQLTLAFAIAFAPFAAAGDLKDDLMAKDKAMWAAWGKHDPDTYKANTTTDYTSITDGGAAIVGQAANLESVKSHKCELRNVTFKDATLQRVREDVAVLIYSAVQDVVCEGKKLPANVVATAVWQLVDGKWKSNLYHESPVVE